MELEKYKKESNLEIKNQIKFYLYKKSRKYSGNRVALMYDFIVLNNCKVDFQLMNIIKRKFNPLKQSQVDN